MNEREYLSWKKPEDASEATAATGALTTLDKIIRKIRLLFCKRIFSNLWKMYKK